MYKFQDLTPISGISGQRPGLFDSIKLTAQKLGERERDQFHTQQRYHNKNIFIIFILLKKTLLYQQGCSNLEQLTK